VSDFPPDSGTASVTGPGGHAAVSQSPSAGAAAATSPGTWSRSFRATADQVREARRFLAEVLGDSPLAADALICLSELASNSVLHSNSRRPGGQFVVRATLHARALRIEVEDEGGPWVRRNDPDDRYGRGLVIVDRLSSDWSASGERSGTRTVWFEIRSP
jgi:serine/threonine-protein kinase RsbW